MASSSRALVIPRFGDPLEVLELQNREVVPAGPGQLRLRMKLAPVNPADLNLIEGTYGCLLYTSPSPRD